MSRSTYDLSLEESMASRLSAEPELAKTAAEVLGRLRARSFYEPAFVDAVFQKWDRFPITLTDAYGFMLAHANVLSGRWRLARVTVGQGPSADKEREENNTRLFQLNPQFGAEFWGGAGDHDGCFWWHDHLHLGGAILADDKVIDGPPIAIGPRRVDLEVGYQAVGKTLFMMRQQGAIARWPYHSESVWILFDCTERRQRCRPIETECKYDEDRGWPCAYVRSAA